MSAPDKREAPRYPVDLAARMRAGGVELRGRVRVLSGLAALFEAERVVRVGSEVLIAIRLGPGVTTEVGGHVVRVLPAVAGRGMVVMFSHTAEAALREIEAFLAGLDA